MNRVVRHVSLLLLLLTSGCAAPQRPPAALQPVMQRVSGQVVGPDGKPVPGALVVISTGHEPVNGPFLTTHTDEQGRFNAEVEASPWQETVARACVSAPGFSIGGGTLTDGANTIRLSRPREISGAVVDEFGAPVPDAVVRVGRIEGRGGFLLLGAAQEQMSVRTNSKGRWAVGGLPPQARASVHLSDPRFVHERVYANVGVIGEPSPTLIARPGASITGRVVYEGGKPASGVDLFAQGQEGSEGGGWAKTEPDGTYELTGLPPGVYNVMVDEASGEWVAAAHEGVTIAAPVSVSIPDLVLTRGALVEGQVFDETTGDPLPGVSVGSYGPHRPQSTAAIIGTRTDANGRYRLRVASGESYIYVSGPPPGYANPGNTVNLAEGETATLDFAVGPEPKQRRTWWPF